MKHQKDVQSLLCLNILSTHAVQEKQYYNTVLEMCHGKKCQTLVKLWWTWYLITYFCNLLLHFYIFLLFYTDDGWWRNVKGWKTNGRMDDQIIGMFGWLESLRTLEICFQTNFISVSFTPSGKLIEPEMVHSTRHLLCWSHLLITSSPVQPISLIVAV